MRFVSIFLLLAHAWKSQGAGLRIPRRELGPEEHGADLTLANPAFGVAASCVGDCLRTENVWPKQVAPPNPPLELGRTENVWPKQEAPPNPPLELGRTENVWPKLEAPPLETEGEGFDIRLTMGEFMDVPNPPLELELQAPLVGVGFEERTFGVKRAEGVEMEFEQHGGGMRVEQPETLVRVEETEKRSFTIEDVEFEELQPLKLEAQPRPTPEEEHGGELKSEARPAEEVEATPGLFVPNPNSGGESQVQVPLDIVVGGGLPLPPAADEAFAGEPGTIDAAIDTEVEVDEDTGLGFGIGSRITGFFGGLGSGIQLRQEGEGFLGNLLGGILP